MSLLRIENPEAAQIISNQKARRFLECFLAQERSVSQVATELRVDMSSVIYRVNQFMRLGLIMLTRVEPRGGRAINYYRTVEDAFFVPFSVVPLAAESELSPGVSIQQHQLLQKSVEHAWAEVWGKSNTQGYHLSRPEKGPSLNVVIEGEYVNPESLYQKLMVTTIIIKLSSPSCQFSTASLTMIE